MIKRIFSVMLALIMALALVPAAAFAKSAEEPTVNDGGVLSADMTADIQALTDAVPDSTERLVDTKDAASDFNSALNVTDGELSFVNDADNNGHSWEIVDESGETSGRIYAKSNIGGTNNTTTAFKATVTVTTGYEGTLSFWYKGASGGYFDRNLKVYVDGYSESNPSAADDWTKQTITLYAGTHTVLFRYENGAEASSSNTACVSIDDIAFSEYPSQIINEAIDVENSFPPFKNDASNPWIVVEDSEVSGSHNKYASTNLTAAGTTTLSVETFVYANQRLYFDYSMILSNADCASCVFKINNETVLTINQNQTQWATYHYDFTSEASYTLSWTFTKTSSASSTDQFYLDNVKVITPERRELSINCVNSETNVSICEISYWVVVGDAYNYLPNVTDNAQLASWKAVDPAVTGTMEEGYGAVTATIRYRPLGSGTLTVNYILGSDSSVLAEPYSVILNEDEAYSVTSPVLPGYTTDTSVVEGTMGTADVTVNVTYTYNGNSSGQTVGTSSASDGWIFNHVNVTNDVFGYYNNTYLKSGWSTSGNVDDWACSPVIRVPETSPKLTFKVGCYSDVSGYEEYYEVYLATSPVTEASQLTGSNDALVKIKNITNAGVAYSYGNGGESIELDLTAYAGRTVQIIFRHCGDSDHACVNHYSIYFWDVNVTGTFTSPLLMDARVEIRGNTSTDAKKDLRFRFRINYNAFYITVGDNSYGHSSLGNGTVDSMWVQLSYSHDGSDYSPRVDCTKIFYSNTNYFEVNVVMTDIPVSYSNMVISATAYLKYIESDGTTEHTVTIGSVSGSIDTSSTNNED